MPRKRKKKILENLKKTPEYKQAIKGRGHNRAMKDLEARQVEVDAEGNIIKR